MMRKRIVRIFISLFIILIPYNLFPQNILEELEKEITQLVENSKPSVVSISSKSSQSYLVPKDNGLMSLFRSGTEEKTVYYNSICSGLIYNEEGYIITKSNRLDEYDEIKILLYDGTEYQPTYIGKDDETGITVLKIEADSLLPCKIGDNKNLKIGSWITILGNSMGISPSISFGLVNGILENDLIQFSAIVCPGNNGSPVFNIYGEVIGILAAQIEIVKAIGINHSHNLFTEAGIAFPIDKTCAIADVIINSFEEYAGWLGIELSSDSLVSENIVIKGVLTNSPAHKAGLKKGDILMKYNNIPVVNPNQLGELIKKTKPGSMVAINFTRDNTPLSTLVRLGRREPFIGERLPQMKIDYEEYFFRTFQIQDTETRFKLQNRVIQLEEELNQIKLRLGSQVVK